ncbi:hypothetical protein V7S43_015747 [Phytophthora oleae]|uniref:BZIP domain-containing protein n=1 Tax=Phytophthora oleae TaxID=2107226 RepID=A0ABD3EXI5_9STRA
MQDGRSEAAESWTQLSTTEKALVLHRQRRRRIQQKYRQKVKGKVLALQEAVEQLHKEIRQLKRRKAVASPARALCKQTSWNMVVEYVRLFRHGYKPPIFDGTQFLDENYAQKRFLQAVTASNIAFNGGFGVDALFEDWKAISLQYDSTVTELVSLEAGEGEVLVARMDNISTITANMVRNALVPLANDDAEANWPNFATKRLGQQLVIQTTVRFEWDEMRGQFVSVYYEGDMLTPLLKLLGNLEEATRVFCSSLGNHCRL